VEVNYVSELARESEEVDVGHGLFGGKGYLV
jgi:hypothetical protein